MSHNSGVCVAPPSSLTAVSCVCRHRRYVASGYKGATNNEYSANNRLTTPSVAFKQGLVDTHTFEVRLFRDMHTTSTFDMQDIGHKQFHSVWSLGVAVQR